MVFWKLSSFLHGALSHWSWHAPLIGSPYPNTAITPRTHTLHTAATQRTLLPRTLTLEPHLPTVFPEIHNYWLYRDMTTDQALNSRGWGRQWGSSLPGPEAKSSPRCLPWCSSHSLGPSCGWKLSAHKEHFGWIHQKVRKESVQNCKLTAPGISGNT